jgi:hypothetical protein
MSTCLAFFGLLPGPAAGVESKQRSLPRNVKVSKTFSFLVNTTTVTNSLKTQRTNNNHGISKSHATARR